MSIGKHTAAHQKTAAERNSTVESMTISLLGLSAFCIYAAYVSGHIHPTNIPGKKASQDGQWDRYR